MAKNAEEIFITMVQEKPILWKRDHPDFKNQKFKELAWDNIGRNFNMKGVQAMEKFKFFRQRYVREKKKKQCANGSVSKSRDSWHLNHLLTFLDEVIETRKRPAVTNLTLATNHFQAGLFDSGTTTQYELLPTKVEFIEVCQPQEQPFSPSANSSFSLSSELSEMSETFPSSCYSVSKDSTKQPVQASTSLPPSSPIVFADIKPDIDVSDTQILDPLVDQMDRPSAEPQNVEQQQTSPPDLPAPPQSLHPPTKRKFKDNSNLSATIIEALTAPININLEGGVNSSKRERRIKCFCDYLSNLLANVPEKDLSEAEDAIIRTIRRFT